MNTKIVLMVSLVLSLTACGGASESNTGAASAARPINSNNVTQTVGSNLVLLYLGFEADHSIGLCRRDSLYTWFINDTLLGKGVDFQTQFVPFVETQNGGHHLRVFDETHNEWIYDGYIVAFTDQSTLHDNTYRFNVQCESA